LAFILGALLAACVPAAAQSGSADPREDLARLSEDARNALLQNRFDEAVRLYERLVKAVPGEPRLRLNLAMALHSAGRYKESVGQLEPLRTSQAGNAKYWFLLGVGYLKLARPAQAVPPLSRAVELDRSYLPARIEYAGALLESGALVKAEQAFLALSGDQPELAKAWQGLAISRLELSRESAEALDKLAPESSVRYGLAALAAAGQKDVKTATALYEKALAAQPAAPWLRAELAQLASAGDVPELNALDSGHPLAAAFHAGRFGHLLALGAPPFHAEELYWRSRAYAELARMAVERLTSLPASPERHELLAVALQHTGRRSEAVAEWREAVRMAPGDGRLQAGLAQALRANRQYEEAATQLAEISRHDPANANWHYELGDCLSNLGRPEPALAELKRAVALQPGLLPAQALLGELLARAGEAREAQSHLEKALPLDRDGSICFQLAGVYRSLGKPELAAKMMARRKELLAAAGTATPAAASAAH
jgi:tetratricopeptide (TPR) repeat protein